jgi:hypothetical protein
MLRSNSRTCACGLRARHAGQPQRQPHVVEHARPGHQRRLLEHERRGRLAAIRHGRGLHSTTGGRVESGHQAQDRALAAARRPDECDELARCNLQADVLQRHHAAGKALLDVIEPDPFVDCLHVAWSRAHRPITFSGTALYRNPSPHTGGPHQ